MVRLFSVLSIAAVFLGPGQARAQETAEPAGPLYVYSARFFCSQAGDQGLPGNCTDCWDTDIALANTGGETARITVWTIEARPILADPPPTRSEPAIELELAPNDAVRIGCGSLYRLLPAEEMLGRTRKAQPNGFLRFESDRRIKAVATYLFQKSVYHNEGAGTGIGLEVVEIEARTQE